MDSQSLLRDSHGPRLVTLRDHVEWHGPNQDGALRARRDHEAGIWADGRAGDRTAVADANVLRDALVLSTASTRPAAQAA